MDFRVVAFGPAAQLPVFEDVPLLLTVSYPQQRYAHFAYSNSIQFISVSILFIRSGLASLPMKSTGWSRSSS